MQYRFLDVIKYIMALFVVGIHCLQFNVQAVPLWVYFFLRWAVPIFFITSGYLLERKTQTKSIDKANIIYEQLLRKSVNRYLIWTVIYLPITLFIFWTNDYNWVIDLLFFIRNFIFVGEQPFSWPLWYLLALIVAVFIIKYFRTRGVHLKALWYTGLIFLLVGCGYDQLDIENLPEIPQLLCKACKWIFPNARNGVFQGLAYVSTGMMIFHLQKYSLRIKFILFTLCMSASALVFVIGNLTPFSGLLSGIAVFVVAIEINLPEKKIYTWLRKESILIYFLHMYFVFLLSRIWGHFTSDVYNLWLLCAILSTLTASIIIKLSQKPCFKWINEII